MYLMYVDESGDCGFNNSPTRYFVLSGLVVHELRWQICLEKLILFRRSMKEKFGLRLREEIHAAALINSPGGLVRIKRNDRLTLIRMYADEIAGMSDMSIINIIVDKQGKPEDYDVFEKAWQALLQRFENTLRFRNFPGPANADERGMIFPDYTDTKKLTGLLRKMRHYNPIPNRSDYGQGSRNLAISNILEDPNFRDSQHSYFIQSVDLAAFLMYQHIAPSAYMRKKSGQNYYKRLEGLFCRQASAVDPLGIVRL